MPWKRMMFKNGKVWAEVDEDGALVVDKGLVRIRYREDDEREYSARADAITAIDHDVLAAERARKKEKEKETEKKGKKEKREKNEKNEKEKGSGLFAEKPAGPVGGFPTSRACATVVTGTTCTRTPASRTRSWRRPRTRRSPSSPPASRPAVPSRRRRRATATRRR